MKLFGITKAGLLAMSIAVFTLWMCLAIERTTLRRANLDQATSLRHLEHLRERYVPVSEPSQPTRSQFPRQG